MDAFNFYDKSMLKPILTRSNYYGSGDEEKLNLSDLIQERTVKSERYGDVLFVTDSSARGGSGLSVCYFFKGGISLEKDDLGIMSGEEVIFFLSEVFPEMTRLRRSNIYERTMIGKEHGLELSFNLPNTHRRLYVARPSVIGDVEESFDEIPPKIVVHEVGDYQPIVCTSD